MIHYGQQFLGLMWFIMDRIFRAFMIQKGPLEVGRVGPGARGRSWTPIQSFAEKNRMFHK
jgi:hypothetical protein